MWRVKVERISRDQVYFEYRIGSLYVRRTVSLQLLTEFLTGGLQAEANLSPGKDPIQFKRFAEDWYLAKNAKVRLLESSFRREQSCVKVLDLFFGEKYLHKIVLADWEEYKMQRLSGKFSRRNKPSKEATVIKEFKSLRNILSYGVQLGLIRSNVLGGIKLGLVGASRADIWLKKEEIWKLIDALPPTLRNLFEFRVWTGARPKEASPFGKDNVNFDTGEIWIHTAKKRKKQVAGLRRRHFVIRSLGSRFEELLRGLKPHPITGLFFCTPKSGEPYSVRYLQNAFKKALYKSGVGRNVVSYDLRGTFCMHRAMVVNNFRQLQAEMGHVDPNSIQSYLDEASHFDPRESIFYGVDVEAQRNKTAH